MEKKLGNACAVGWREKGDESEMVHAGPTYWVQVPTDSSQDEMEEVVDTLMAMPTDVVGSVIVLREDFQLIKMNDGPKNPFVPDDC